MRIIKIIITVIVVVTILFFVGTFVFLKTVDLNRFKARITEQISRSINRDVSMKHVSFNFSINRGVTLNISGLSVMDISDFSTDPMLYIDSSHLDVDILPFILRRQILVSKIELDSLRVNLIRNDKGEINFQELAQIQNGESDPSDTKKAVVSPPENALENGTKKKPKDLNFKEILIRSIRITDGTFIFTDHMASPSMTIPVTEIEFQISNLSLDAPFLFQLKASLFSGRKNIGLNGLARINAQNQQVRIDDLKIQTDLSLLSLGRVYDGMPSLKDIGLKDGIDGKLEIDVHQMVLSEEGLLVLSADGRMTGIKAQFENSPIPIENLEMQFSMTESDVEIKEIKMPLASGEIKMSGRLIEYLAEQKFSADLKLSNVQLSELALQMNLPVKLEGQFHAGYKLNGLGLGGKALESSLAGEGILEVKEGRIVDMNILKLVLSEISFIPDLFHRIEANLPGKYKEKLKARDTIFGKVEMDTTIREGIMFINKAEINADGFLVLARGKLDLDQNLSFDGDFYISPDLSSDIADVSEELKGLLDEHGGIHTLLKPYDGKLENFRTYPDVEGLGKEIIRNWGKEKLKKVISQALGTDDEKSGETPSEGGEGPGQSPGNNGEKVPQERELSSEEMIIENIFDMIPIF
ncbi:MAG: AsmA family protein [Thermodesulfovibrionia bacterium]|nr:AsmA family protein [Thermodesulfovibrionia bacterium]